MDSFDNTPLPETWDGMLRRYKDEGWSATLLTFMFDHMFGGRLAIQAQQRAEVEAIYGKMLTRIVRDPDRPSNAERLLILLSSPDFPVFKHAKQALRDVTINDGQHVHSVALTPPANRLRGRTLEEFIEAEHAMLTQDSRCRRIHAQPIIDREANVLRYTGKSEERGLIDADAFFVLPRSLSEVREGPDRVGRQASIFARPEKIKR